MPANLSLEIGKRALIAQRFGLDVTSSNIANVNTKGYSRRDAVVSETSPLNSGGTFMGTGAMVDKLRTFREEYFDREIRSTISRNQSYETDENLIQRVETILGEPSDTGINEMVTKFFNSFDDLASKPDDMGLREQTLSLAKTLVETFHNTAQQLSDARNDVYKNISSDLTEFNKLTKDIAKLNDQISLSKIQSGAEFQSLVDSREDKLEDLSKMAGITITPGNAGSVNVFINGINIITGPQAAELKLQENINSATGEKTLQLGAADSTGTIQSYITPQNGELSSYLKHYNTTFDPQDTSTDGYSIAKKLNDFASAIATKVNNLTVGGYGLNDTGTVPPGRMFFDPPAGPVTAFNIDINTAIASNSANIPLADAPDQPGNNKIALNLANLKNDSTFIDGMSPSEFYSAIIEKVGSLGSEATNGKNMTSTVSEQLNSQRDSVIGVNLDDEAVNLIKFQKAFEASSRIINMTSDLLNTIITLGK